MLKVLTVAEGVVLLAEGQIIAYPTEAVYGLGVDAANEGAVRALCALKQRPLEKGLIVLVSDIALIKHWLAPIEAQLLTKLTERTDGYHHTWLMPISENCPAYLAGVHATLAVRLTSHPVAHALCLHFDGPIVSTSANIQGQPAIMTANALGQIFTQEDVAGVVAGAVGTLGAATKIQDLLTDQVFRR